jgi:Tfp pilus assembly protein PilP
MRNLKPLRYTIIALVSVLVLAACGDSAQKQKELELKEKELDLKSQELASKKKVELAQESQAAQAKKIEKIVRKNAVVVTQSGGNAILRSQANKNSRQLEKLYDMENIVVVGETQNCEIINNHQGCWVKVVSSAGTSGYLFDAYMQYR